MILLTLFACFHTPIEYNTTTSVCISGLKEELIDKAQCTTFTTPSTDFPGTVIDAFDCKQWTVYTNHSYLLVNNDLSPIYELEAVCMDGTAMVYLLE